MNKEKRIQNEYDRLINLYADLDEAQIKVVKPLVQNASFMAITLQDLQKEINEKGVVEKYQNGANQYGVKQSSALQSYNALIKNFTNVTKQLLALLPQEVKENGLDRWLREMDEQYEEEQKELEEIEEEP